MATPDLVFDDAMETVRDLLAEEGFTPGRGRSRRFYIRGKDRVIEIDLVFQSERPGQLASFEPTVFTGFKSFQKILGDLPHELAQRTSIAYGLAGHLTSLQPPEPFFFQLIQQSTAPGDITSWLVPRLLGPVKSFLKETADPVRLVRMMADEAHPFYSDARLYPVAVLLLEVCADRPNATATALRALHLAEEFRRDARRSIDIEAGEKDIQKANALLKYVATR